MLKVSYCTDFPVQLSTDRFRNIVITHTKIRKKKRKNPPVHQPNEMAYMIGVYPYSEPTARISP